MEEAQLRFGDITSTDLKLWLSGPNDHKCQKNVRAVVIGWIKGDDINDSSQL